MRKIDIEEYKKIVTSILKRIENICKDNDLSYFLAYGTLIGAVRHEGFIPWDDDADIGMLRSDYIKLRDIINAGDYGLKFIDIETEKNTIYPFGKICDTSTHMIEKNFKQVPGYGAFVDVFPFDNMPNDTSERQKFCKNLRKQVIATTHASRTGFEKADSAVLNLKRFAAFYLCKLINLEKCIKSVDEGCQRYNKTETDYVGVPWERGGLAFEREKILPTKYALFDGAELQIPADPNYMLEIMYGDYMTLPPEDQRVNKHQLICFYKGL